MTRAELETKYAQVKQQYEEMRMFLIALARKQGALVVDRKLCDDQQSDGWRLASVPADDAQSVTLTAAREGQIGGWAPGDYHATH